MKDNNIFILDYKFDLDLLELYWDRYESGLQAYSDPRYDQAADHWQISRSEMFPYAQELCDKFKIKNGKPRFYRLKANTVLPMHIDLNTECSLNIVLSSKAAPVDFEDNSYVYNSCILNTSVLHGVTNGPEDRRLFKISIFDQSFEEVCNNIIQSDLMYSRSKQP